MPEPRIFQARSTSRSMAVSAASLLILSGCSARSQPPQRSTNATPAGEIAAATAGHGGSGAMVPPGRIGSAGASTTAPNGGQTVPPPGSVAAFNRDDTSKSGLPPNTLEMLKTGSGPCTTGIAYPSEGTLFPGGLPPPTLMWPVDTGRTQIGAYLHLSYEGTDNTVNYELAVAAETPGEMRIPADAWREITARSNTKNLNVELKLGLGDAVQACTTRWRIARGNVSGSLYYYQTEPNWAEGALSTWTTGNNIGIFRLRFGADAGEPFMVEQGSSCIGCHAMNVRGTRLVAERMNWDPLTFALNETYSSFDISTGKAVERAKVDNSNWGAMTPDGKYVLTVGNPDCTTGANWFVPTDRGLWWLEGTAVAHLQDVETGKPVDTRGINPDHYMWMPQFSPDGTKVVFNHAKLDPKRPDFVDRRELAMMDYDESTQTFSNLKVIVSRMGPDPSLDYTVFPFQVGATRQGRNSCALPAAQTGTIAMGVCQEPCYPAWPAFTPDNRGVIFVLLDQPDFNHRMGRTVPAKAELYYLDLASGQTVKLENAMRVADQAEYGRDNYPTVLPISAGGYAWVFWTGRRSWGTRKDGLFFPNPATGLSDPAGNPKARKIWVSGIQLRSGDPAQSTLLTDPSYPAFYLEGQGDRPSMRAFAALNACSADGQACITGVDCCTGFCTASVCGAPTVPSCSKLMEACKQASDCCQTEADQTCIGGFCDVIILQ